MCTETALWKGFASSFYYARKIGRAKEELSLTLLSKLLTEMSTVFLLY